jgi:hypothetical protein
MERLAMAVDLFNASMIRRFTAWTVGSSLLLLQGGSALGQRIETENNLKAAHLFRFAQFVEWPATAFTNAESPIMIGILGEDYLSKKVQAAVDNQQVHGRTVKVTHCSGMEEAERCHILFISRSERNDVNRILAAMRGKSVLTVSDMGSFSSRGGMIRLLGEGSRIRFRINTSVAESEGLIISSKLLRLAERVDRGKKRWSYGVLTP